LGSEELKVITNEGPTFAPMIINVNSLKMKSKHTDNNGSLKMSAYNGHTHAKHSYSQLPFGIFDFFQLFSFLEAFFPFFFIF